MAQFIEPAFAIANTARKAESYIAAAYDAFGRYSKEAKWIRNGWENVKHLPDKHPRVRDFFKKAASKVDFRKRPPPRGKLESNVPQHVRRKRKSPYTQSVIPFPAKKTRRLFAQTKRKNPLPLESFKQKPPKMPLRRLFRLRRKRRRTFRRSRRRFKKRRRGSSQALRRLQYKIANYIPPSRGNWYIHETVNNLAWAIGKRAHQACFLHKGNTASVGLEDYRARFASTINDNGGDSTTQTNRYKILKAYLKVFMRNSSNSTQYINMRWFKCLSNSSNTPYTHASDYWADKGIASAMENTLTCSYAQAKSQWRKYWKPMKQQTLKFEPGESRIFYFKQKGQKLVDETNFDDQVSTATGIAGVTYVLEIEGFGPPTHDNAAHNEAEVNTLSGSLEYVCAEHVLLGFLASTSSALGYHKDSRSAVAAGVVLSELTEVAESG